MKNLIREKGAKYVIQTGNFYFRPKRKTTISLPRYLIFFNDIFYFRDFIWIITLTKKSKFDQEIKITDMKV